MDVALNLKRTLARMKIFALLCCPASFQICFRQTVPPENTAARAATRLGSKAACGKPGNPFPPPTFSKPGGTGLCVVHGREWSRRRDPEPDRPRAATEGVAPAELNEGNKLLLDRLSALGPKIKLEIANGI